MTTEHSGERVRSRYRRRRSLRVEWKPQDCWVGAFWRHSEQPLLCQGSNTRLDVWVCVLPMLPIHYQSSLTRRVEHFGGDGT